MLDLNEYGKNFFLLNINMGNIIRTVVWVGNFLIVYQPLICFADIQLPEALCWIYLLMVIVATSHAWNSIITIVYQGHHT